MQVQKLSNFLNMRTVGLAFFLIYILAVFSMIGYLTNSKKFGSFQKSDVDIDGYAPLQPYFDDNLKGCYINKQELEEPKFVPLADHYVMSTPYLDRRNTTPTVLILGIKPSDSATKLYCLVPNTRHKLQAIEATEKVVDKSYQSEWTSQYSSVIFQCVLIDFPVSTLCKVWLSFSPELDETSIAMPLKYLKAYETVPPKTFQVCVPPLYGVIQQQRLVEFIEAQRIFGAEHFRVYSYTGDNNSTFRNPNIQQVLKYYTEEKIVSVSKWTLPVPHYTILNLAEKLATIECVLEAYMKYSLVIPLHINEFLVPWQAANWTDMFKQLIIKPKTGAYCFEKSVFKANIGELLISLNTTYRDVDAAREIICAVRPDAVVHIALKYVKLLKGWNRIPVTKATGRIHDYKVCTTEDDDECSKIIVKDKIMERFGKELEKNFKLRLKELASLDNW